MLTLNRDTMTPAVAKTQESQTISVALAAAARSVVVDPKIHEHVLRVLGTNTHS